MTKRQWISLLVFSVLWPQSKTWGAFSNYNSILIGEKAAGMGGAFTALTDDPAACSFYNPAGIARMEGATLSASINAYHKYDIEFGEQDTFNEAPFRVNRGSIVPIPSSSGTVYNFGNFAWALSIVFPDFDIYTGAIGQSEQSQATVNLRDESLWIGGSLGLNASEKDSFGLTVYYTSRTYSRTITDDFQSGSNTTLISEEKTFSHNNLIYLLGYRRQWTPLFRMGVSYRFASLPISGEGAYSRSQVSTDGFRQIIPSQNVSSNTEIPSRLNIGLAYGPPEHWTISLDIHHYGSARYRDLEDSQAADLIEHVATTNVSLGAEWQLTPIWSWRSGLYTNFSSHPEISENPQVRTGDRVDMWGFSTNIGIHTSPSSLITLGGYYSGGKGHSTQLINNQLRRIQKTQQIFSFLVGTSFEF